MAAVPFTSTSLAPCHAFLTKPISLRRRGAETHYAHKSLSALIAIKILSKPGETTKAAKAIYSKLLMAIV